MNPHVTRVAGRVFSSLRFRNFRLYFFSQILSFSGTWMQTVAQAWLVLELTGSGTALGTVIAMQYLPILLFAPVGGMIADRVDKRRMIMVTQFIAGLLALILGIITVTDVVELWMVYALAVAYGIVTAIDNPSRQTFVMEMVGPADISNAVTLNSVVVNVARAIGPAVGGVLIATVGVGMCFVANSISYLAVVVALFLIRTDLLHSSTRSPRGPGQLRAGLAYVRTTPALRNTLIMLTIIGTLGYEFTITLPLLSEFTYDAGAEGFAAMTALMGAGAVVGGLIVASAGPPTTRLLSSIAFTFGAIIIAVSLAPTIEMTYGLMPFLGMASISLISSSNATLQINADPQLRGRVMALFSVAIIGSTPIGGPIMGYIGEHTSPRLSLFVGGSASVAAAAYYALATTKQSEPGTTAGSDPSNLTDPVTPTTDSRHPHREHNMVR